MDGAALLVPRSEGPWRVQAHAGDHASTWRYVPEHEAAVALTLLPAADFRFAVTADGAPLRDSRLYLVGSRQGPSAPADVLGFEVSDQEGAVALTLPKSESSGVAITHDERSAKAFRQLGDTPAVIELGPGLTVSGQTLDEKGTPLGAVRLRGLSFPPDSFGLMQRHRGRTGPDGRFAISGFSRGQASLETEQGDLAYSATFNLERSIDLGPVVLKASEFIWIRAVDSRNDAPVPHARIQDPGGYWSSVGEDGLLRLSLDFGRGIHARAEGYVSTRVQLPAQAGLTKEEPLLLGLEPAFQVEGVFLAADGVTPATGGNVIAMNRNRRGGRSTQVGMEHGGSFSLDLQAGAYELELTAGNAGYRRIEVQGVAGESLDLGFVSASPTAWVRGQVLGKDDFLPVKGASLSYRRPSRLGPLFAAMIEGTAVTTDDEGYFEMHGLELGTSTIRVQAEGFASRDLQVEAPTIQGIDVGVVELSRGRRVTVRSNVADGMVVLDMGRTGLPKDRLNGKLTEGRAEFDTVPEAPFGVVVYENGDPVCEEVEETATGDEVVTCNHSAARVTGLVTRGGQPGSGTLLWQRASETQLPEGNLHYRSGPFTRTEAVTSTRRLDLQAPLDTDGSYQLEAVLPGEWEVIWAPLSGGSQDARTVTVPKTREAVLDFRYDSISIEGLVLDPEGQPVARASVTAFPSRRTVGTNPDGRFEILGLEPGIHQLRARFQNLSSALVDAELSDAGSREVVQLFLDDDPSATELEIVLHGSDSGFCFVEMESALQRVVRIKAGVANVTPEPPLPNRLRVACLTDGRWILDGWRDLRAAMDRGLEFDPLESTSSIYLAGTATSEEVQIVGPGGWDLGRLRLWVQSVAAFSAGESVPNLPVGEYTIRFRNQARTVWTEPRRVTSVELDEF